jgi:hypothetical protein
VTARAKAHDFFAASEFGDASKWVLMECAGPPYAAGHGCGGILPFRAKWEVEVKEVRGVEAGVMNVTAERGGGRLEAEGNEGWGDRWSCVALLFSGEKDLKENMSGTQRTSRQYHKADVIVIRRREHRASIANTQVPINEADAHGAQLAEHHISQGSFPQVLRCGLLQNQPFHSSMVSVLL